MFVYKSHDWFLTNEQEIKKREQKVKVLEQMFDADRDHGYMDKDRLRFMLEKLKIMDKGLHDYLLQRYDQDYNGKVDFEEFWYSTYFVITCFILTTFKCYDARCN